MHSAQQQNFFVKQYVQDKTNTARQQQCYNIHVNVLPISSQVINLRVTHAYAVLFSVQARDESLYFHSNYITFSKLPLTFH